jgi:hypothetical protein
MENDVEQPRPNAWRAVMKLGDIGNDVSAWRFVLLLDNYALSGASNAFTPSVHNATVAWQRARGLRPDGIVGEKTRLAINEPVLPRPPALFDPSRIPYVEAASWSRDVGPQPKDLIVLHSMEAAEAANTAENVADWFAGKRGPAPRTSCHYCVDSDSVIGCVPPDRIAWHAPGANAHGIGIEHAGYARQTRAQWLDDYSLSMLSLSASLTAWLCTRFGIPILFIGAEHVRRGWRGITTHAEVTRAFPEKGSHTDPGPFFPMSDYLRSVVEARQLLEPGLHSGR